METDKKARFERSAEAGWIIDRVVDVGKSDDRYRLIGYEELDTAVGGDARCWLHTARRALRDEYGIVIITDRGKGVRIARDHEINTRVQAAARRRIGRAARNVRKVSACCDTTKLSPGEALSFYAELSIFGMLDAMSKDRKRKELEDKMRQKPRELNLSEIVDQVRNG